MGRSRCRQVPAVPAVRLRLVKTLVRLRLIRLQVVSQEPRLEMAARVAVLGSTQAQVVQRIRVLVQVVTVVECRSQQALRVRHQLQQRREALAHLPSH